MKMLNLNKDNFKYVDIDLINNSCLINFGQLFIFWEVII